MPLMLWIAWAWIKSTIFPLLGKIPWQIWGAIAVAIAFFYYGHIREKRGRDECYAQVEVAKNTEIERQKKVTTEALANAEHEKNVAQQRADELKERLDNALADISKLEDANKTCLPKSVTDQFRGVRRPQPKGTSSNRPKLAPAPSGR
jgi:flagellar motility protein MotE (MotC chaperone)